jgi:hypothetical protein
MNGLTEPLRGRLIEFKQPVSSGQPPRAGEDPRDPKFAASMVEYLIQQIELGVNTVVGYSDVMHAAEDQGVSPSEIKVTAHDRTQSSVRSIEKCAKNMCPQCESCVKHCGTRFSYCAMTA